MATRSKETAVPHNAGYDRYPASFPANTVSVKKAPAMIQPADCSKKSFTACC